MTTVERTRAPLAPSYMKLDAARIQRLRDSLMNKEMVVLYLSSLISLSIGQTLKGVCMTQL